MENYIDIHILQNDENPRLHQEAARIFYQAFRLKVHKIELFPENEDQAVRILAGSFIPDQMLVAKIEDKLVGMLGIDDDRSPFMKYKFSNLTGEFGLIGGITRYLWSKFIGLIEMKAPGTLRIAAIAVEEEARGKGFGKHLLDAAESYARSQKYRAIVLEVVDTNPRARSLYERFGFRLCKTKKFGFITRKAGFTASDYLQKDLN